jgi:hypothetical protein
MLGRYDIHQPNSVCLDSRSVHTIDNPKVISYT